MIAALALGPKQGIPFSLRASTAPKTSGSSGATTAESILLLTANSTILSISLFSIQMLYSSNSSLIGSFSSNLYSIIYSIESSVLI